MFIFWKISKMSWYFLYFRYFDIFGNIIFSNRAFFKNRLDNFWKDQIRPIYNFRADIYGTGNRTAVKLQSTIALANSRPNRILCVKNRARLRLGLALSSERLSRPLWVTALNLHCVISLFARLRVDQTAQLWSCPQLRLTNRRSSLTSSINWLT